MSLKISHCREMQSISEKETISTDKVFNYVVGISSQLSHGKIKDVMRIFEELKQVISKNPTISFTEKGLDPVWIKKEIENIKNQLDSKQGKKVKNKEEFKTTLNDLHNALSKG